ncbi:putative WRKY transcription factor 70 [Rosa sericea]
MESLECTWPASWNLQEKVKEELVRGHELANQLHLVFGNGDGESAKGLATKIVCSFTNSLSLLCGNHDSKGKHIQANTSSSTVALPTLVDSSSWVALEAIKSTEMLINSRSSSKKRKTSHSWSRDAPDFIDDGHTWRKYGLKQILNASHPRSYFRCSHKYDQGCKATKQVQKVEDDPSLFRTTYLGNHTCKHSLLKAPESILDNVSGGSPREESNSKFMITFENNNNFPYEQEHPFFSSYSSTEREIIKSNHVAGSRSSSLSCDYLVPPDQVMVFESSEPISKLPTMMELHSEDMITFENNNFPYEQEHPFFSSYSSTEREIIKSNHVASSQSSSLSCDYLVPPDPVMVFESSEPISRLPTMMELHSEDMIYY